MIQVSLKLSQGQSPSILELDVSGHGVKPEGSFSLSCASITVLLRSFAASMETHREWVDILEAREPGHFRFAVLSSASGSEWYRGVSDIILRGIAGIEGDFPEEIDVEIRGENHGT